MSIVKSGEMGRNGGQHTYFAVRFGLLSGYLVHPVNPVRFSFV